MENAQKGDEKSPIWMQIDESRQGVLVAAKLNLVAMKTTLVAVRENLTAVVNPKIK